MKQKTFFPLLSLLALLLLIGVGVNLSTGYMPLEVNDFLNAGSRNAGIAELRMNRVWAMLLAGLAIPTSGFLLQEYFQNPLAGPSVLGITSVASLSAACYLFFFQNSVLPEWLQNSFIGFSAIAGSFLLMLVLLLLSKKFKDQSYLIIFGFLVSAMAGAVISVLQLYAENQSLKNYILWSFGANNMASQGQLSLLTLIVILGLATGFACIKPLMGNVLGEPYARSFGIRLDVLKYSVIIASSLLSASVTAFLGPILFIGIVVPHFSRMLYPPAQLWQQWMLNMVLGMGIMQFFSIFSEISHFPINVITSLFGVPVILLMMIKNRYA